MRDDRAATATAAATAEPADVLRMAQQQPGPTLSPEERQAAKLERALRHAMAMERKAATRVKRATTILHKWARTRRRVERKIGEAQVRQITSRLRLGVTDDTTDDR